MVSSMHHRAALPPHMDHKGDRSGRTKQNVSPSGFAAEHGGKPPAYRLCSFLMGGYAAGPGAPAGDVVDREAISIEEEWQSDLLCREQ